MRTFLITYLPFVATICLLTAGTADAQDAGTTLPTLPTADTGTVPLDPSLPPAEPTPLPTEPTPPATEPAPWTWQHQTQNQQGTVTNLHDRTRAPDGSAYNYQHSVTRPNGSHTQLREYSQTADGYMLSRQHRFYRPDGTLLREHIPDRSGYGKEQFVELAEVIGHQPSWLYKVWRFPGRYNKTELNELCKTPISWGHVVLLLPLDKLQRTEYQRMAASRKWTVENLRREGIPDERTWLVGNVMIDTLLNHRDRADASTILADLAIEHQRYAVLTLHRPANVDRIEVLTEIIDAVEQIAREIPVVFPIHPRTRASLERFALARRAKESGPWRRSFTSSRKYSQNGREA